MSQTAEQISVQDLDARLPVPSTGDALQRLSVSLNHMLSRLRDSVQTAQRFLADASHELRTPLTVVKCELEELVADSQATPEMADRIGSVLEEVHRLKYLVEGLLVLSRLDTGEAQRESVCFDLREIVTSTAEQMQLLAEDGGIDLQYFDLQPVLVQGDRTRLKQVVVNLLDNALKYTSSGGKVTLKTFRSCRQSVLEVRDTGIGIPHSALSHLFDRFYRVDDARSRDSGGVGLGLSIVSAICSAHGAELSVDSTLGAGSCFIVRFPEASAIAPAPQALASASTARANAHELRPSQEA
jgi:signal transduction histidine kinase